MAASVEESRYFTITGAYNCMPWSLANEPFAGRAPGLGAELADLVLEVIREDLPQPRSFVSISAPLETSHRLVRLQQRLFGAGMRFAVSFGTIRPSVGLRVGCWLAVDGLRSRSAR